MPESRSTGTGGSRPYTIDLHTHLSVPAVDKLLERVPEDKRPKQLHLAAVSEAGRRVNSTARVQWGVTYRDPELRIREMDKNGIDLQVLSPGTDQFNYWTEPSLGLDIVQAINDYHAETVAKRPDRFLAIGAIPMQAPKLALDEMDRAVKKLGLKGFEICTVIAGGDLSMPSLEPIWSKAEELDVPIFLHPTNHAIGQRTAEWHLINIVGNPLETTIAVSHLVFGGVLARHPKLKMYVGHGGGFIGAYSGRWDHGYAFREDCRTLIDRKPTDYLKQLSYDMVVFTHPQLELLVRTWGADHVVLGTDFPADMGMTNAVPFVETANLTAAEKTLILNGNAAKLLKVDVPYVAGRSAAAE